MRAPRSHLPLPHWAELAHRRRIARAIRHRLRAAEHARSAGLFRRPFEHRASRRAARPRAEGGEGQREDGKMAAHHKAFLETLVAALLRAARNWFELLQSLPRYIVCSRVTKRPDLRASSHVRYSPGQRLASASPSMTTTALASSSPPLTGCGSSPSAASSQSDFATRPNPSSTPSRGRSRRTPEAGARR